MRGNLSSGQPVKMFAVQPGTYQNFQSNTNLIVNPLLSVQQVSVPEQDLVPSINRSPGPLVKSIYSVEDELGQIQLEKEDISVTEPIYDEIKPKLLEVSEGESKVDKFSEEEHSQVSTGKKKEIEYWQITAKEIVKFRPCTETFINKSYIKENLPL